MAKTLADLHQQYRDLRNTTETREEALTLMEEGLRAYYSSAEGRAEIDATPNRGMTTEEAVYTLMTHMNLWSRQVN